MLTRSIKTRVFIEDVVIYDKDGGFNLILECRTPSAKRFAVTLHCGARAHEKSVAGRNFRILEKMLDYIGVTPADLERDFFLWKLTASRVLRKFFWFKLDVDSKSIFLRDVRPSEPFPMLDEMEDMEAACAALEALVAEQEQSNVS